jgi:hypothetical protein
MTGYFFMRVHERVFFRSKIEVYRLYDSKGELTILEEPYTLEVYDISLGGMGVLTKKAGLEASILEFTLYIEDYPYRVMTKIVWHNTNGIFHRYGLEIIGHNNMLFRHLQQLISKEKETTSNQI